jgi:signal transduction histidine kinase
VRQLREGKIQEEKNRADSLQSYTSTMSHEFRTPLGTSLMFLENLMNTEGLPQSVLDKLNIIIMQLTFLLSLVNGILDIKMIESG